MATTLSNFSILQQNYEEKFHHLESKMNHENQWMENLHQLQQEVNGRRRKYGDQLYQEQFKKNKTTSVTDDDIQIKKGSSYWSVFQQDPTDESMCIISYLEKLNNRLDHLKRKISKAIVEEDHQSKIKKNTDETNQNQNSIVSDTFHIASVPMNSLTTSDHQEDYRIKCLYEYVDLFRSGLDLVHSNVMQQQYAFLQTRMKPTLQIQEDIGLEHLLNQWEMNCWMTDYMRIQIIEAYPVCDSDNENEELKKVQCKTELKLRVTRRMIATLYPHMSSNLEFMNQVIGKLLTIHSIYNFRFDQAQIQKMDFHVNFFDAWLNLLNGDNKRTMELMNGAQLEDSGYVICEELIDVPEEDFGMLSMNMETNEKIVNTLK